MKISTRVKLVVIGALFAAILMVGAAWAAQTADAVKQTIEKFGLAAAVSGNTITVTNTATKPLVKDVNSNAVSGWYSLRCLLDLGDISGLTIDWKADLTVKGELAANSGGTVPPGDAVAAVDGGVVAVLFKNGKFNMTAGTIDLQATTDEAEGMNAIEGKGKATITMSGGTLKGLGLDGGIVADNDEGSSIVVTGGTIDFPNGVALNASNLTVNGGKISGLAVHDDSNEFEIHGTANSMTPFDFDEPPASIKYTVKSGAVWTVGADVLLMATEKYTCVVESGGKMIITGDGTADIKGHFTIENGGNLVINTGKGSINIHGTLTNKGTLVNNSTVNNHSGNTLDNQGTLTNNGTIDNKSTGKMKNTGTIDNEKGAINNDGTFQSDQTKDEMGGKFDGNEVEPVSDNPTSSSGSSGCDAGFGSFALLALFAAISAKRRKG